MNIDKMSLLCLMKFSYSKECQLIYFIGTIVIRYYTHSVYK